MTTTLAITGVTGFVGSHVLDQVLAAGYKVRALKRRVGMADTLTQSSQPLWIEGTLDDTNALADLCDGADAVIHIAGAVNVPTREAFDRANNIGTANIVDAAIAAHVRRFVHVSSLAAREPALSSYGWSKANSETQASRAPHPVIVRPPGVYGPRDSDMLEMFKMARRGVMLLPPAGRGSWIHVHDLARLLLALADAGPDNAILEPDDGQPLSHRAMAAAIGKALGRERLTSLSAPRWLLHLAARGDRLVRGDKARLTPDRAAYMSHPDWTADPARRPDPALWTPQISSAEGFADTARWYQRHGWL